MIETKKNNIIMIDGGGLDDAEHLEQVLKGKGGIVDRWYITIAHKENFGALEQIIKNGNIEIRNIYMSFNSKEWYEQNEPDRVQEIEEFSDLLNDGELKDIAQEIPYKYEILVDDLYISALKLKSPELESQYLAEDQSMVIRVDNTYKSMIFMCSNTNTGAKAFKDDNLDLIDCDAVQISNNGKQNISDDFYQLMTPKYLFMNVTNLENASVQNQYLQHLKELLGAEQTFNSLDGDVNIRIW